MSSDLRVEVCHDLQTGLANLVLSGDLTAETAPVIRRSVLTCFAEYPRAVLIDLNGMAVRSRLALAVFSSLLRQEESEFGVPLLFYATTDQSAGRILREALPAGRPVYEDRQAALSAVRFARPVRRRFHIHLPARPTSPAVARAMVAFACRTWQVPHLTGDAKLIVSELVTNAIEHAGTDLDVTTALRMAHLHLQVRDRSLEPPKFSAPRDLNRAKGIGLVLVNALAARWGTVLDDGGKAVWALLRAHPAGP
jgi:anti-sigma regulatory factor (Ser/Thr protein kinase)